MMFCNHCEDPITYDDRAAKRCPHCGKNPTGSTNDTEVVATTNFVVPDHARGAGRGNNRDEGSGNAWPDNYPVPGRETKSNIDDLRVGDTVNVSCDFAAGKYEGPAKVVTTKPLQIQFNFGPTKAKRTIAIGSDEIDCRDIPI